MSPLLAFTCCSDLSIMTTLAVSGLEARTTMQHLQTRQGRGRRVLPLPPLLSKELRPQKSKAKARPRYKQEIVYTWTMML